MQCVGGGVEGGSMQAKIDRAEEHGSIAQMEMYRQIKNGWGDVPYTNLPNCRFSQLLFKVRSGTLPVLAFKGKRDSPHPHLCICCHQGTEETIQHFLWECNSAAANIPCVLARGPACSRPFAVSLLRPKPSSHAMERRQ